jgi:hypothetical protein
MVTLITDLHKKKEYKDETLYAAVNIADRYLSIQYGRRNSSPNLTLLACVCMLIAAKLEQPISPSFNRMLNLIPETKRKGITKKSLIDLES